MREQVRKQRFSGIIGITLLAGMWISSANAWDIGIVSTQQTPLNLRTGPATHHTIIETVQKGDSVLVLETIGDWYLIRAYTSDGLNISGYVRRQYITVLPKITDIVDIYSDGSVEIPGTFPKEIPVILLKNGASTTQTANTVEPFLMQLGTPEEQLEWT